MPDKNRDISNACKITVKQLKAHQEKLKVCQNCKTMQGTPVVGNPVASKVLLLGQAPGVHEAEHNKPFAWQAGKTLFSWFAQVGVDEAAFRTKVYMAAVCRCYPGKAKSGGDRLPSRSEIKNCNTWLETELDLLKPALIIPIGKLAISRFLTFKKLTDVIGQSFSQTIHANPVCVIPLPHPSGVSSWPRTEPGKTLLQDALTQLANNTAWIHNFQ